MNPYTQNTQYAVTSSYVSHTEAHRRWLAKHHPNHAGQITIQCRCGRTFDVGYERFHTDAFQQNPLCYWCFVDDKETP